MSATKATAPAAKPAKFSRTANAEKRLAIIADPKRDGNREGRALRGLRDEDGGTVKGFGAIALFVATFAPKAVTLSATKVAFLAYATKVDPDYVASGKAASRVARFFYEAAKHAKAGKAFRVNGFEGSILPGKTTKDGEATVVAKAGK